MDPDVILVADHHLVFLVIDVIGMRVLLMDQQLRDAEVDGGRGNAGQQGQNYQQSVFHRSLLGGCKAAARAVSIYTWQAGISCIN